MSQADLHALATAAGLVIDWEDAQGRDQRVSDASLSAILTSMGLACDSAADRRDSLAMLAEKAEPALITAVAGQALELPGGASSGRLILEGGKALDVTGRFTAPAAIGYHRLEDRIDAMEARLDGCLDWDLALLNREIPGTFQDKTGIFRQCMRRQLAFMDGKLGYSPAPPPAP